MMRAGLSAVLVPLFAAHARQPVRVDAGHADVSPNAISLRKMEVDLRVPAGFEGVYQLSKSDVFGRGQPSFMRIDGAVTAVFPRSVYVPTPAGLVADIPPGTVFQVGPLPQVFEPRTGHVAETFLDLSVGVAGGAEPPRPMPDSESTAGTSSMITDEWYRHRRIDALLSYAAARR